MCMLCIEYSKKRMTKDEYRTALLELLTTPKNDEESDHYKRLVVEILDD